MKQNQEKRNVWDVLERVHMKLQTTAQSGRAEHTYLQLLEECEQEKNLDKFYQVVDALERGIGFPYDKELQELLQKAFEEDSCRLFALLAKKEYMIDCCMLINLCSTEMLGFFVQMEGQEYPFFLYECARQLLNRDADEEAIVAAVQQLSDLSQEFWQRWLQHHEYNLRWQQLLGHVLGELSAPALEIYAKTVSLDRSFDMRHQQAITSVFQMIPAEKADRLIEAIAPIMYQRWERNLAAIKASGTIQQTVIMTPYIDVIYNVLCYLFQKKADWKQELKKWSELLITDIQKWYQSESQLSAYFFTDITQIYLLLFWGQQKWEQFCDEDVINLLDDVKKAAQRYDYLWRRNEQIKGKFESLLESWCEDQL